MLRKQVIYKNSILSYLRFGKGQQVNFCFHGYGETADSFSFLNKHAGEANCFIAMDLPFHGHSVWNEGLMFKPYELKEIVFLILDKEGLHVSENGLNLIGFSLGGRVALSLFEFIPERISKLILLAPDGLKVNFWYWLATQTFFGNRLFAFTMKHPKWYFLLLKIFYRLKIVNNSIYKFVQAFIHDEKVRSELYIRWTAFRKLKPNLSGIKRKISENKTSIRFIYGKHDRIIRFERAELFMNGIEEHCDLNIINAGHQVLNKKNIREILSALLH